MNDLSPRQRGIYLFICRYREEHGYSPSRIEIAENLNIHSSTIRVHLSAMKQKGYITWNERIPRSIKLLM
jgi:repressor LexA